MPASVTEDLICLDDSTPNTKISGTSLDVMYLVKNISLSQSPMSDQKKPVTWYSESVDFASELSLEASTPHSKSWYGNNDSTIQSNLNSSSLECKDIGDIFNFNGDVAKKILSTPDPVVSKSALRRFGMNIRSRDNLLCLGGFSISSDSGHALENKDCEVQFDLEESSVSDILEEKREDNFPNSVNSNIPPLDQSSSNTGFDAEQTPKMTSYVKKHQFNSIFNARTPRPKRTMKRKVTCKSVPSYGLLDVTSSPGQMPRTSLGDAGEINNTCSSSTRESTDTLSMKSCRYRTLSDVDFSKRGSEAMSDCYYASYLDYADFFKADVTSPVNDSPFETFDSIKNSGESGCHLQTIPEIEPEGHICTSSPVRPMAVTQSAFESKSGKNQLFPVIKCSNRSTKISLSRMIISAMQLGELESIRQIRIGVGLVPLIAGIQFIHRPMSFRTESPLEKEDFSLARLTSTTGCRILREVLVPATLQAILKNELFRAMGNGNSRAITSNKFLPNVGKKQAQTSHALQRRRYGPREVHRNIWRLERKINGKPGKTVKDAETVVQNVRPEVPKRSTCRKRNAVAKEIEVGVKELEIKVPCAVPNADSLPSRSDVLPPDGDSLRSDVEKKHLTSEGHSRCPSCTSSQLKLSKAYAQKGAVAVTLEKTQRDLNGAHARIKDLECELDEYKKTAEELSVNIKDLETEMCQLQKDKALLQQELMVTRKQLTRILDQSDASDSSHVSSVFVSGSQNLTDDGLGDETMPDEDGEEHDEDGVNDDDADSQREYKMAQQAQLDTANAEVSRLREVQAKNEELELTIRHCEERIIELEELLKQATVRSDNTKSVSTQTLTRDGTFTRSDKTKIPKRMLGHHSSLPVISDPNNLGRCKTPTGSLTRLENLQRSLRVKEREITTLKKEMNEVGKELEKHKEREASQQSSRIGELTAENRKLKDELDIVKENYQRETVLRKKYFNIAEDLKGKIRVYCRIKPFERMQRNASFLEVPDEYTVLLRTHRAQYEFTFDGVFDVEHSQEDVFKDVQNLVQSAVDGYNVCIFAYGQTGSGKTYTLVGNESQPGIGPRAFQKIFDLVRENQCELDFRICVSVFELYNERLIDLLKDSAEDNLKIRRDHYGLVYVQGSESREIKNERQLSEIFEEACRNRHVGATRMNTESSRSHLVITIRVDSTNKITGTVSRGKLSIIDLAGSERVGKTAAVAQQLKEANSINKSLSALGDVIAALSSEQQHVPYRNNKLTLLMQDSLGSNAKTLMFVNISSSEQNVEESLNSLTYASRVKQITNSASRMAESKEVARLRSIIMKLSKESKSNPKN